MANILRTASIWLKGAIISFAVGLLLFIIGFATNSWIVYYLGNNGLWQVTNCDQIRRCHTYSLSSYHLNSYHQAIQAMECLGLIGYFLALLILLLYLFADSCRRKDFLQATLAFTLAGVVFASIGLALYGSTSNYENKFGYHGNIGWSMGLAITGTILYALGGIFLIVHLIR